MVGSFLGTSPLICGVDIGAQVDPAPWTKKGSNKLLCGGLGRDVKRCAEVLAATLLQRNLHQSAGGITGHWIRGWADGSKVHSKVCADEGSQREVFSSLGMFTFLQGLDLAPYFTFRDSTLSFRIIINIFLKVR